MDSSPSAKTPSNTTTAVGARVERMAELWLLERHPGARVLDRNFRIRAGEIDLVFEIPGARGGLELVFVEVRARTRGGWVSGIESVTVPKRLRLERAIRAWLGRRRRSEARRWRSVRVDILDWDGTHWNHLVNAWTA